MKTPGEKILQAVEEEKAREQYETEKVLKSADTRVIMQALYDRGVTIKEIFGAFYELEEAGNGRTMDVEDAQLAFTYPDRGDCF